MEKWNILIFFNVLGHFNSYDPLLLGPLYLKKNDSLWWVYYKVNRLYSIINTKYKDSPLYNWPRPAKKLRFGKYPARFVISNYKHGRDRKQTTYTNHIISIFFLNIIIVPFLPKRFLYTIYFSCQKFLRNWTTNILR